MNQPLKVAVAGISGFVGQALMKEIADCCEVYGLSRTPREGAEWRLCDLFSLKDAEEGLKDVDIAFYLVHSMLPSAKLMQGSFQDFDLIAADNFARAAEVNGLKQIIYLGGILPPISEAALSLHLRSRLEVEQTLRAYSTPVTVVRAGMIIGPSGSSFKMMLNLVRRLPLMFCPPWAETASETISLRDIVRILKCCMFDETVRGKTFEAGCGEIFSYRQMMSRLAKIIGLRRWMVHLPLIRPGLSRLWISIVTGAPRALVSPLIESLQHPMVVKNRDVMDRIVPRPLKFDESIRLAMETKDPSVPRAYQIQRAQSDLQDVRSAIRLPLPMGKTARWVAEEYLRWLEPHSRGFIQIYVRDHQAVDFGIRFISKPLLSLELSKNRSDENRHLLYIRGGLLARDEGRGRLEFRQIKGSSWIISAIHDFRPRLPWFIYRYTQAVVHWWVMNSFSKHLRDLDRTQNHLEPSR